MEPDWHMHSRSSGLWRLDELTQLFVIGDLSWIRLINQKDWWGPTELAVARRFRRTALLLVETLDVFSLAH